MHPRNIYGTPPDFRDLADAFPSLRPHIIALPNGTHAIDYKSEVAQRCLTQALLMRDFDLILDLPEDRLCPPVPNRLNYILWVQDIVRATHENVDVVGIDIGTGSSAIYPLLGCRTDPSWSFIATEIDKISLASARANVDKNGLQDRIVVVDASQASTLPVRLLLPMALYPEKRFTFTMCNPPFYASASELQASMEGKALPPSAVCTGSDIEMITPGGEVAFVGCMIDESLQSGERCLWYTSMLGRLDSIPPLVSLLRAKNRDLFLQISNYAITELTQGRTRRYALAWSFSAHRLPDTLARLPEELLSIPIPDKDITLRALMPARNTIRIPIAHELKIDALEGVLREVYVAFTHEDEVGVKVRAEGNTWSRSARRKKKSGQETSPQGASSFAATFECTIMIVPAVVPIPPSSPTPRSRSPSPSVSEPPKKRRRRVGNNAVSPSPSWGALEFSWTHGRETERPLFEGFCSHVGRHALAVA
ncbi:hypothetical protein PLICRDRAFT_38308 [Plicaturopsis crispa FD-325 SS-3]|nr:hypothetical protein PLICRDRAFT_38308 [Plicaturopsis crispa FD-325 SS-3]